MCIVEYELCTPDQPMLHESPKSNSYSFVLHVAGHEQKMSTQRGLEEVSPMSKRSKRRLQADQALEEECRATLKDPRRSRSLAHPKVKVNVHPE